MLRVEEASCHARIQRESMVKKKRWSVLQCWIQNVCVCVVCLLLKWHEFSICLDSSRFGFSVCLQTAAFLLLNSLSTRFLSLEMNVLFKQNKTRKRRRRTDLKGLLSPFPASEPVMLSDKQSADKYFTVKKTYDWHTRRIALRLKWSKVCVFGHIKTADKTADTVKPFRDSRDRK